MSKKVPTVVYRAGDVPNKAVIESPEWVISMLEERGGGIRFHDMRLADMAEALFNLSVLLHQSAVNWAGREEQLKLYRLIGDKKVPGDWTPAEAAEAARLTRSVGQLMPCDDALCRFCKPGGFAPSEN